MQWSRELVVCGAGCIAGMMNALAGGGTVVTFPVLLWAGLSGMNANIRTIGASIGTAVVSSIVTGDLGPGGLPTEHAFTTAFVALGAAAALSVAVALLIPRPRRADTPAPQPEAAPSPGLATATAA